MSDRITKNLPIPDFFNPEKVGKIWRVPYQQRAKDAKNWATQYKLRSARQDKKRVCLLLIDVQNTFCISEFELFVTGAVEDNIRLCKFIYSNLNLITEIIPTLDTHKAMAIFHPIFWVDEAGKNPEPNTIISLKDVETGKWKVNPEIGFNLNYGDYSKLQKYAFYYLQKLEKEGKYPLTIWPYHSMLGGIGHALVSAVEEAIFFHNIARNSQTKFEIKGDNILTENYSVLRSEVLEDENGNKIGRKNNTLIEKLLNFDAVIIAGQAKSHCVAWTIADLLVEIKAKDPQLTQKIYLLEDCTSPVVVPGIIDFTSEANKLYQNFARSGMNLVKSTESIGTWLKEVRSSI